MRRLAMLLAPLAAAAAAAPAAAGAVQGGAGAEPATASAQPSTTASWHLVFSDGFGSGSLRTTAWTPNWLGLTPDEVTRPPNSYEIAAFEPAQVTFSTASPGVARFTTVDNPWTWSDGTNTYNYEYRSGAVTGYQKQGDLGQGYLPPLKVVARLRIACTSAGLIKNWPSLWLVGDPTNNQWPQNGEIDIMEGLSGKAYWHAHYLDSSGTQEGPGAQVPGNWCGWHIFQVKWLGTTVKWFYDSVKVGQITTYATTAPEFPVIMYSMAPLGKTDLSDCPPNCGGPMGVGARLKADYIRVYKWY